MILIVINDFLFMIIVFLLALFLSLLITLVYYYTSYVKESSRQKKWVYDELNQNARHHSTVFLGDSLTDFYRTSEFFLNYNIYNRGIAGDSTDDVLRRIQTNVIDIKPKRVFLQIGTNDLGYGKKPDYVVANIEKIVNLLTLSIDGVEIFIISLYPVNSNAISLSKIIVGLRKNADINYINSKLIQIAKDKKINYIDMHQHLIDEKGNLKKEYTVEGLHISLVGYKKVTEVLEPYVYDSHVSID